MTESSTDPIFDFRHKRMSVLTPEAKARQQLDRMLADAGIDDDYALLEPDALAAAIVEDLAAALEQFREIVADLEEA